MPSLYCKERKTELSIDSEKVPNKYEKENVICKNVICYITLKL